MGEDPCRDAIAEAALVSGSYEPHQIPAGGRGRQRASCFTRSLRVVLRLRGPSHCDPGSHGDRLTDRIYATARI